MAQSKIMKGQRVLYGTNLLVEDKTKSLKKVSEADGGWTIYYTDSKTGEKWVKYSVDLDRGYFFNLMRAEPEPTTDELIEIALTTEYYDEISAASSRLFLNEEISKIEYRDKLLENLKQLDYEGMKDDYKKRVETIIKAAQLTDRVNKREILGKSLSQINQDSQFFNRIADSAEEILNRIE